jgi:hypothetical protein
MDIEVKVFMRLKVMNVKLRIFIVLKEWVRS